MTPSPVVSQLRWALTKYSTFGSRTISMSESLVRTREVLASDADFLATLY